MSLKVSIGGFLRLGLTFLDFRRLTSYSKAIFLVTIVEVRASTFYNLYTTFAEATFKISVTLFED